jgi:riboflavin synthase
LFSGIVEEVGKIISTSDNADGRTLRIGCRQVISDAKLGDSISVSGCCLTVTKFESTWFEAECTHQTLRMTKLGDLKKGDSVNLERALRLSDRLGGHLVTGHIDGIGRVHSIKTEGFSKVITFDFDDKMAHLFVEKGSVGIDGVSLTVASLGSGPTLQFSVALIPHTMDVTTLGGLKVGDPVNVEADLVAKYVARWLEPSIAKNLKNAGLSLSFLSEHGYT